MARRCGYRDTTTGRPCEHLVDSTGRCAAGHPVARVPTAGPGPAPAQVAGPGAVPEVAQLVPPAHRVRALMDAALMQPDCSQLAPGPDVLADPARVEVLLAGPAASPELHVALVQRYGRVGAWLVVGAAERAGGRGGGPAVRLVERFAGLDATGLTALLDELEPPGAGAGGHRLDATFAVAARDRSPGAHRAYMAALLSRRSA